MMMFENLPECILVDVLARLPFESLIRFRCVSKSSRDLIDTKYCSKMHYSKRTLHLLNTNPHPDSMIIARIGIYPDTQLYAIGPVVENGKQMGTARYEVSAKKLNSPLSESFSKHLSALVGSCNGVLCFRRLDSSSTIGFVLWNPFTRSYLEIPPPPPEFYKDNNYVYTTFVYDHINDDCKIMMFYSHYQSSSFHYCAYSLKHESWKTGKADIPVKMPFRLSDKCVIANGALHWLVHGLILAFDLAANEFRVLPCCPKPFSLYCVDGCLMLLCRRAVHRAKHSRVTDMWVTEDYGVSWTKVGSIDMCLTYEPYTPLAFLEGRRKLLFVVGGKLEVFDLETKSFSEVAINEEANRSCLCGRKYNLECYYDRYYVCIGSFASPTTIT